MTYVLSASIILIITWMIFGGRALLYLLSLIPSAVFCNSGHYIYATMFAFIMLYLTFINNGSLNNKKRGKIKYYQLLLILPIAALPLIKLLKSPTIIQASEPTESLLIITTASILIVFIIASSTMAVGMKRIKGDKDVYE